MTNQKTSKTMEVKSLTVLEEISKNKCMGLLNKIIKDETDNLHRPIYVFKYANNLNEVIGKFGVNTNQNEVFTTSVVRCVSDSSTTCFNFDDRSMDGDRWDNFDANSFYGAEKENTVITRNYRIVNDIFEAGYAGNLCGSFYGKDKKRGFVFIANDEIRAIKAKGDAESKAHYEGKMKNQENGTIGK
ncbi:MAG: hypothetical protein E7L17_07450 [Clostridium sp.]|uniref:hypothetical protein n=1 Tax=Clostridium sp. TaxID=1506 RepID=UPI00290A0D8C|nr:hypothetical protein [Clostridium sp.]MDU7337931.1 hypothetical protein [Clostridium sp.]